MGILQDGHWVDQWYETAKTGGAFKRENAHFHHKISNEAGAQFPAEANRYHLYVSLACPWAHRTLIFRHLKNLTSLISVSIVHPHKYAHNYGERYWVAWNAGTTCRNQGYVLRAGTHTTLLFDISIG